jgi:hypothetical protein
MTTMTVTRDLLYHAERPERWLTLAAGTPVEVVERGAWSAEMLAVVRICSAPRRIVQDDGRAVVVPGRPVQVVRWADLPDGWTTVPTEALAAVAAELPAATPPTEVWGWG